LGNLNKLCAQKQKKKCAHNDDDNPSQHKEAEYTHFREVQHVKEQENLLCKLQTLKDMY